MKKCPAEVRLQPAISHYVAGRSVNSAIACQPPLQVANSNPASRNQFAIYKAGGQPGTCYWSPIMICSCRTLPREIKQFPLHWQLTVSMYSALLNAISGNSIIKDHRISDGNICRLGKRDIIPILST